MNPPPLPTRSEGNSERGIFVIVVSIVAATAFADFFFWFETPGLSLSLFTIALAALTVANRSRQQLGGTTLFDIALLAGAAAQSAIEISFSNVLVILMLLVALGGESFYKTLVPGWARCSEMLWSFAKLPGRWLWLLSVLARKGIASAGMTRSAASSTARIVRIILPALVITCVFAFVLANGNAILGKFIAQTADRLFAWLTHLDISIGRIFFWIACAVLALPLIAPSPAPGKARWWTRAVPRWPAPRETNVALWQSRLTLLLLNLLFFAVNTIDAIYLWIHATLPAGVSYSSFVHRGVFVLIFAVLLSAVVLTAMFQQADPVARERSLRLLALAWVIQNVILIVNVLLRLKLYVDAYQLTALRIYVALFLLLVSAGFALLTMHIFRPQTLNWLILSNLAATFVLFYIVQFLDVARFIADYNVARWKADPAQTLDLNYLQRLGPSAWPSLIEVSQTTSRPEAGAAQEKLDATVAREREYSRSLDWRSWQARRAYYARKLLEDYRAR